MDSGGFRRFYHDSGGFRRFRRESTDCGVFRASGRFVRHAYAEVKTKVCIIITVILP